MCAQREVRCGARCRTTCTLCPHLGRPVCSFAFPCVQTGVWKGPVKLLARGPRVEEAGRVLPFFSFYVFFSMRASSWRLFA